MERDQISPDNLQERKNILIAEIMTSYRDLLNHAAAKVDSSASAGQAGYSSMALEIMMSGLIKSTEDLLNLTRQLRELWVVGPLQAPGQHDAQAEAGMARDAERVFGMLNALRDGERARLMRGMAAAAAGEAGGDDGVRYVKGAIAGATTGGEEGGEGV